MVLATLKLMSAMNWLAKPPVPLSLVNEVLFSIIHFDELTSTNDYIKNNYRLLPDVSLIRADYQSAGRGQFSRNWESNRGQNLLVSLLLKTGINDLSVHSYEEQVRNSLISLLDFYGVNAHIKLPNDIFVGDRKISGILIETKQIAGVYEYLIIGIGLNVGQTEFPDYLNATSIALQSPLKIYLEDVFNKFISMLEVNLAPLLTKTP
ncbi:MAG TPA: biotin--[acetyl-CoA-carboxylase] ligase [Firmicutes bacterium]|nr:biotin--[acetyl-CoA-carboxylase] ligase [Bacillota bacterium]